MNCQTVCEKNPCCDGKFVQVKNAFKPNEKFRTCTENFHGVAFSENLNEQCQARMSIVMAQEILDEIWSRKQNMILACICMTRLNPCCDGIWSRTAL